MKEKLDKNNYYIKAGYESQKINYNLTENREGEYWSKFRLRINHLFQKEVYIYATEIVKRHNLKSIADVGCGAGEKMVAHLQKLCTRLVGIDTTYAISTIKNKDSLNIDFIVDNFEKPSNIPNESFDLIICSDVIEHMMNPDSLLEYIKKIMHPGSFLIISTPERDFHRGFDCMKSGKREHIREWNTIELKTYVESMGFYVQEHFMVNFISTSILNPRSFIYKNKVKKTRGTTKTTQVLLCRLK